MDDPVEHRRLTLVALRIMGDVLACIAVPIATLAAVAHGLGGGPFLVAAFLLAFAISTVTVSLRSIHYNRWYLQGHGADPERGPPPADPPSS